MDCYDTPSKFNSKAKNVLNNIYNKFEEYIPILFTKTSLQEYYIKIQTLSHFKNITIVKVRIIFIPKEPQCIREYDSIVHLS